MKADTDFDYQTWRQRLNWTPAQAAAALGVGRTYYWKLERDKKGPRMAAWAAYGLELHAANPNVGNEHDDPQGVQYVE